MADLRTIDFFEDKSFLDRWQRNLKGELDLGWLQAKTEKLAIRAENPRRGLTFRDLDKGGYGFSALPDLVRQNRSFAPRGAELPPGLLDLPHALSSTGG